MKHNSTPIYVYTKNRRPLRLFPFCAGTVVGRIIATILNVAFVSLALIVVFGAMFSRFDASITSAFDNIPPLVFLIVWFLTFFFLGRILRFIWRAGVKGYYGTRDWEVIENKFEKLADERRYRRERRKKRTEPFVILSTKKRVSVFSATRVPLKEKTLKHCSVPGPTEKHEGL